MLSELERKWVKLRQERNMKLGETDFTQLADFQEKLTVFEKEQWRDYRQALRDLPNQTADPEVVVWPEEPS